MTALLLLLCNIPLTIISGRYASLYARSLIQQLREEDDIYVRPLGNVIYLMCGPCTTRDVCTEQLSKVYRRISHFNPVH